MNPDQAPDPTTPSESKVFPALSRQAMTVTPGKPSKPTRPGTTTTAKPQPTRRNPTTTPPAPTGPRWTPQATRQCTAVLHLIIRCNTALRPPTSHHDTPKNRSDTYGSVGSRTMCANRGLITPRRRSDPAMDPRQPHNSKAPQRPGPGSKATAGQSGDASCCSRTRSLRTRRTAMKGDCATECLVDHPNHPSHTTTKVETATPAVPTVRRTTSRHPDQSCHPATVPWVRAPG